MSFVLLILSVFLGAILVLLLKPSQNYVRLLLSFSGAYLLSVTVLHLLPEIYHHHGDVRLNGILILCGLLTQSLLESFSKGAEHGHIHLHSDKKQFPWMLFISLSVHAFSEGIPIHNTNNNLLWAILIHKIPIAIVLTSFLLNAKYSKTKIFVFIGLFSLMSPLGFFIGKYNAFFETHHSTINAFIVGTFLHISTIILFESNENHKFNFKKFTAVVLGILLTVFTL